MIIIIMAHATRVKPIGSGCLLIPFKVTQDAIVGIPCLISCCPALWHHWVKSRDASTLTESRKVLF